MKKFEGTKRTQGALISIQCNFDVACARVCLDSLTDGSSNTEKCGGDRARDYWEPGHECAARKRFSRFRVEPDAATGPEFRRCAGGNRGDVQSDPDFCFR